MAVDQAGWAIDHKAQLAALASPFAQLALHNVVQPYPHKFDHVMTSAADRQLPVALHPVFYGSYDWHSSVHMHWLLVALLRRFPGLPEFDAITTLLNQHFTPKRLAVEMAYLQPPHRQSFERTYGWAWLLKLQAELRLLAASANASAPQQAAALRWGNAMQPLADAFITRFLAFLPIAQYPIRAGTHANSAFGLLLALDYAQTANHQPLASLIHAKTQAWFGNDTAYPAAYEPGGDDFLSGGLVEAALVQRTHGDNFALWWSHFCPPKAQLQRWLKPVEVSDRTDPKLSHLDGLNLSRAWCWGLLMPHLEGGGEAKTALAAKQAIAAHLRAGLPHTTGGDYVGSHWLASFALLALDNNKG